MKRNQAVLAGAVCLTAGVAAGLAISYGVTHLDATND